MKTVSRSSLAALGLLLLGSTQSPAIESNRPANRPAQPSTTVAPAYPNLLRHRQAVAAVTVAFPVAAQGKGTKARIVNSRNHGFNEAALAATKQWSFTPALKNGQAVETKLAQKFNFSGQAQLERNARTLLAAEKGPRRDPGPILRVENPSQVEAGLDAPAPRLITVLASGRLPRLSLNDRSTRLPTGYPAHES